VHNDDVLLFIVKMRIFTCSHRRRRCRLIQFMSVHLQVVALLQFCKDSPRMCNSTVLIWVFGHNHDRRNSMYFT